MTSVVKSMLFDYSETDDVDEYSVEYSFAMEYDGPPLSYEIPEVVPVDVGQIPTANAVAKTSLLNNLSLPVVQPIAKSAQSKNRMARDSKLAMARDSKLASEVANLLVSRRGLGEFPTCDRVCSSKSIDGVEKQDEFRSSDGVLLSKSVDGVEKVDEFGLEGGDGFTSRVSDGHRSSGTLGFSDSRDHSNELSGSSGVEDLYIVEDNKLSSEISSFEGMEDCIIEVASQGNRIQVVTFRDLPSGDAISDRSVDDETEIFSLERPVARSDLKKGSCHRCLKVNRFNEKEFCIVCGAKYCKSCVLRVMGSMPEGRKCIPCIGFKIDESKRGRLGKCSRMLKRLLTDWEIEKIMNAEVLCKVNQLPPHLFFVNGKPLSLRELVQLQSCSNPPKKLKPGAYWYDKESGYWGTEGEKPCQIITPLLAVGDKLKRTASNGDTNVLINGREITTTELWMLQLAGIRCEGELSYWVSADGSYQLEGQKNVMGKIWDKTGIKLFCAALSLPVPPESKNPVSEVLDGEANKIESNKGQNLQYKLLLVGCDQSGTSTLFKQAKILNKVPFSEEERQNIKYVIQRNLYSYVAILLEGREKFEEDYFLEMRQNTTEPGTSNQIAEENIYSISGKLKTFSDWLLQVHMSGNLEACFPAATREYSSLLEALWKDKGFQATYQRRSELNTLPGVASYFLDRVDEISKVDYEPSDTDILYAEGITSANGVASMEFSVHESPLDEYTGPGNQEDSLRRYQVIRVNSRSLGENCKWLEMFEDIDLVLFCVSLTNYNEFDEGIDGACKNKMLATRNFFEQIVSHPAFAQKHFLLILNKLDLLEEVIEKSPLALCDWFEDFNPVLTHHSHSRSGNNSSLAQSAFHYVAVKFKRLFTSLTGRKLYVSPVTGFEPHSVDEALKYVREILKYEEERAVFSVTEWSSGSVEPSTT